ncbi:unnamed protein product [Rotaria socialis]|uniref:Uncharacterized protein n=1 Tax=Rotaria socialis TaxID=392032 RepID=A0A818P533_9BILA|nr:unnamed protein product [Rotaria socialis]CAF3614092.1 unnamed protein product [Rotaria socialis]CAF3783195.1 unnamed protein product [Rotaria socialis]CAF4526579.1 unnamed protein product [Rotaria socialis]CAF4633622.1 unnamed protein product [Rotaria socialis]
MTYITLLAITNQLPLETLRIWLFSSQTSEETFCAARSMSGSFSSVSIKSEAESDPSFPFRFPRHQKQKKLGRNFAANVRISTSLSSNEIKQIVQCAFADACALVAPLGINTLDKHGNPITLDEVSVIVKAHLQKTTRINDDSQEEASDSSSESDNEASDRKAEYSAASSDSNNDQEESDSECLSNVSNCTFRGMRIYDTVKLSLSQSYFKVSINGQTKILHKQTTCWLLMHDKTTLSSDRTTRVMNK